MQDIGTFLASDPNANIALVSGAWVLPLLRSGRPIDEIRKEAARLQKREAAFIDLLSEKRARARTRIWTLAEFLERPLDPLQETVDSLSGIESNMLVDMPETKPLTGLPEFLQSLRNSGMNPYLAGEISDFAGDHPVRGPFDWVWVMTDKRFDYFVVLAGMRTGSNLLEEQLAAMPGIESHGELFNPHFFGKPEFKRKWGLSMKDRDADPIRVVGLMKRAAEVFPGFRLFHDHDDRAIDHVLKDPRAAKIILTRRPIDSYVSLKIARKTGQWWLGDMTSARAARVSFVAEEYADFLNELSEFQKRIAYELQVAGQTAFYLSYDDLSDDAVIAGLGAFFGLGRSA